MTQVLKMGRKALTVGIVLTTLAWSMMATVLVAPLKASAAGCTSGSLIKGSLAAVYYCGADGKRYVFTNDKNYWTWYPDFSGVMTISDAELATLQIGGNVTYRPGVKMIKIQSDPKVYAISHGGVLRPIASEAIAACLYGSTWNRQIDDVSDAFFTNYTVGTAINNCSDYDRNAEMSSSQTINQDKGLTPSPVVSGNLQTSLASDNPSSRTIPAGATSVNFLKFNLHNADSSAAVVTNLTLHRVGPGATTDIANVYLYEGSTRLTSGRTVNSSTNDVSFTGLNWTIAAGQTRTFWVAVDISTTPNAGAVHAFQVSSIQAGPAVVGGLPLVGNNMTLTTTLVGSLQVDKSGSFSNPKLGQLAAKIGEFKVQAGSAEDVWLNRITLFQGGSLAAANLTNLKLTQAGNTVATASSVDSKLHVVFNLAAPMLLEKGASKTFEVWADISGSARVGDTIQLYVEENSDVYGIGATYGYGVRVTRPTYDGTSCTSTAGFCSWSSIEGGQVTITFNGPSSQNLASNSKDRELFNFTIASQANVEIKKLTLLIDCGPASVAGGCVNTTGTATPNYTDIKVTDTATGQVWWGPQDLGTANDTQQTLIFNDVQDLAAGSSHTFKVTADIASNVPTNDTIKVTLVAFGGSDIRNLDNNTFVATGDIVPSGNIAGNQHTIVAPSLVVSLASTPVSQSFVKGSTSVPFTGVNLTAGDGTAIKVNSLTLTGFIDTDGTTAGVTMVQGYDDGPAVGTADATAVSDDILSCKLFDGTTQVGDTKSPTVSSTEGSGGTMTFSSLNLSVAASATKSLTLKCDTSNSAFRNGDSEIIGFAVQSAADVTAQDPDGSTVTATGNANATAANVRITITNSGSITTQLAPDDSESEASLVIAGSQSAVLAKWRFTAANEELKLVKLTTFMDTAAARRSLTSVSLYDGATLLAGPVSINQVDNTNGSASATAVFSGMNLVIPKDGSKTVTLKGALNTISSGGVTGDNLKMRLYIPGSDSATNTSAFEARGTSSSTVIRTLATSGTTITPGNDKLVRKTKPTVSLASLPSSTLVAGTVVASRFTITADAAENLSLKKLSFKAQVSGGAAITTNSPAIREVGQGSDISSTGTAVTAGTNCGFAADALNYCVRVAFTNEQVITAGTSKTFELRFAVTVGGTSSVSTSILGDTVDAVGELNNATPTFPSTAIDAVVVGTDGEYNFIWSDNNQIPHNDTLDTSTATDEASASNDWMNAKLVKVLPGDVQTLSQ